jgi:hypothetical protein
MRDGGRANVRSPEPRTDGFGFSVFAFRVSFSVQSGGGSAAFGVPVAGGADGCEPGCLCALAPHGAGDCLPRHDPQSIAPFSVASGCFCSQNQCYDRWPSAMRAKGS